ncbi:MAG TPA: hypothetical protein VH044_03070 [Polyangiaceae bacterium]|nr:hypothetical protein [Polyangiaceae bacterium]
MPRHRSIALVAAALVMSLTGLPACGGSETATPSTLPESSVPDATSDALPSDPSDDGSVEATVEAATEASTPDATADASTPCSAGALVPGLCPSTLPSTLQQACAGSPASVLAIKRSSCSNQPVISYGGAGVTYCVYASAAPHPLVGTISESDVDEFCNDTSYLRESGSVPAGCYNDSNASTSATILGSCDELKDAAADAVAE